MSSTRTRAPSDAQLRTADRVHSAAIHLLRRLRRQDRATGLSPARASALSVLVFGGPVTLSRLADAEQVSTPTMTRLVAGLERDGLLRREPDSADRRLVWLHPTPKGIRTLQEGRRRRVEDLAARLASLPPQEIETIGRAAEILERISRG
jgi:DNA-binding MarR family transcriptional regulator